MKQEEKLPTSKEEAGSHLSGTPAIRTRFLELPYYLGANAETLKADSHIACRAHAAPLSCRAAKGLECVFHI